MLVRSLPVKSRNCWLVTYLILLPHTWAEVPLMPLRVGSQLSKVKRVVVVGSFYIALFSALEQTQCARM